MIRTTPYSPFPTEDRAIIATITAVLLLVLAPLGLKAQQPERYQKVIIDREEVENLPHLPSFDDHTFRVRSEGIETILSESDVLALQHNGVQVTVLIPDLQQFYAARSAVSLKARTNLSSILVGEEAPVNFALGSVAGYYSLEELQTELQKMQALYPNLVSEPISIGKSAQGRDIWAVRISAHSESEGLPEILYTGMHHAREPIGMMSLVYTMWWLLEGSSNDPQIAALLQKRALWFIPVVNPDGYAYNIQYFPLGGGLWRKNRHGADGEGVDLNRNYGLTSTWQTPPDGGTDDPLSGTYRGPTPFSEPETQAMRSFVRSHDFRTVLNFHSFSNLLIYVHDGNVSELADTSWYLSSARELALENGLAHGRGAEAVGYPASGTADEWLFRKGSDIRHIFAWTPEVGSEEDGFWPVPERIPVLCRGMIPMSIRAAWMAGPTPRITSWQSVDRGNEKVLALTITNVGLEPMAENGEIVIDGFQETATTFQALEPGKSTEIEITLPQPIVTRTASRSELTLRTTYQSLQWTRVIDPIVHPTVTLFSDDFEGSLNRWNIGLWDVETNTGHGRVLSDSPYENYFESDFPNIFELQQPISLAGYDAAELQFDAKVIIQGIHHQLAIEARRSGERTWHPLDGEYLQKELANGGDARSAFRGGSRVWKRYSIPLTQFVGEDVVIRFVMETPYSSSSGPLYDGALIDNLTVTAAHPLPSSIASDDAGHSGVQLSAWPNPCRDRLYLQLHESAGSRPEAATITMSDLLGREMLLELGSQALTLDMRDIPSGTYILSVKGSEGIIRRKIVKQ